MVWLKRLFERLSASRGSERPGGRDIQDKEGSPVSLESIRTGTEQAIISAAAEAHRISGREGLFGFALLTDDHVETLFHAYATRDWVAKHEGSYPEIGFIAVEWTESGGDDHFLPLSNRLKDLASLQPQREPRSDEGRVFRFEALVDAMSACREAGVFDEHTLLSVGSTDPDELMLKLTCDAAVRLNTEQIATAYRRVMGT